MQLVKDVVLCSSLTPRVPPAEVARDVAKTAGIRAPVFQSAAAATRRIAAEGAVGERQSAAEVAYSTARAGGAPPEAELPLIVQSVSVMSPPR